MKRNADSLSRGRVAAGRIAAVALLLSVVAAALGSVHDNERIRLHVAGSFTWLDPADIRQVVTPLLADGFFRADVDEIREAVESLAWVRQARIRRAWPYGVRIRVWEREPAAVWNDEYLLDTEGNVFGGEPAPELARTLPRLHGAEGTEREVLETWDATAGLMADSGHSAYRLERDLRGAWRLWVDDGVELRLGREQVSDRVRRFVGPVSRAVGSRLIEVAYIDLRHTNGFAVGWRPEVAMTAREGRGS